MPGPEARSSDSFGLDVRAVAEKLSAWYRKGHRPLPWRETRDPYAIWVSEVMLQQTRVEKVLPYFVRFLARFPSITSLSSAMPDEVLKLWEGLGYYGRARHLVKAAREVEALGAWPRTAEELARLPGIGRSTAGAIASIAFREKAPILDGNVRRVLARLVAYDRVPAGPAIEPLWRLSESAVRSARDPALVNQALMELGATVCTAKRPACGTCPIGSLCSAHARGSEGRYPLRVHKPRRRRVQVSVAVLWRGESFLVQKRPDEGFLGGLWELPGGKWQEGEDARRALLREIQEETGSAVEIVAEHPPVRHAYTHFEVTIHPFECTVVKGARVSPRLPFRWIRPRDISVLAFPAGTLKVFDRVFIEGPKVADEAGAYIPKAADRKRSEKP